MTEVFIGDLRTGQRLVKLDFVSVRWEQRRNAAESFTVKVPLTPSMKEKDLYSAATPTKAFCAIVENDTIVAAGPIWMFNGGDDGYLELTGSGMWSYFDHRHIIPLLSPGEAVDDYDDVDDQLVPAHITTFTDKGLGAIARGLVQLAVSHTGGDVPIVFGDDEAGTHERNYPAPDLSNLGTALRNLTAVENGPDIEFRPRWTADRLGVEWLLVTGTEAVPRITSEQPHKWDRSVPEPGVKNLQVRVSGSNLVSRAFNAGGRSTDQVLIEETVDTTLTDNGFPLLEQVDASHGTVSERATLQSYGSEQTRVGAAPVEFWTFQVKGNRTPLVGQFRVGDPFEMAVANHPLLPSGIYSGVIAGLSGDEKVWVTVQGGSMVLVRAMPPLGDLGGYGEGLFSSGGFGA